MASRRRELTTDDDPWRVSAFISALMELLLSVLLLLGAAIAFITSQLVKYFGLDPPCAYIGCSHPLLHRSSKRRMYSVRRHHHPKVDHSRDLFPDCRISWVYSKLQLQSEEFLSSNDDTDRSLISEKNDSSSRRSTVVSSDLDVWHGHLDKDRNVSYDLQRVNCACSASSSPIFKKSSLPKYIKPKTSVFNRDGKQSAKEECIPLFPTRSVSACSSDFGVDETSSPSSEKPSSRNMLLEDEEPSQRKYVKPNAATFVGDITLKEECVPLFFRRSVSAHGSDFDAEDDCEMSSSSTYDFKNPRSQKEMFEGGTVADGNASISSDTEHEHRYMLLKDENEEVFEAPIFYSIEGLAGDFEDEYHDMLLEGEDVEKGKAPFFSNLQAGSAQPLIECISDSGLEPLKILTTPDLGNKVANVVVVPESQGPSEIEQAAENCAQCDWIRDNLETTCTSACNLSSGLGEGQNTGLLFIPLKVPAITESIVEDEGFDMWDKGQINTGFSADETNMEYIQGFENVNAGNAEGIMVENQVGEDGIVKADILKEPLEGLLNVHVLEKEDIDAKSSLFPMEHEFMVPKDLLEVDKVHEIIAFKSGSESVQGHVEEFESVPIKPFTAGSDACDTENILHGEENASEVSIEGKSDEETIVKASLEVVIQEAMDQHLFSFKGRLSEDRMAKCASSLNSIDVQQVCVGQVEVTKGNSVEESEKPGHHAASQTDERSSKVEQGELVFKDSCEGFQGNTAIHGSFTEGLKINQSFDIKEAERGIQKYEISSEQMILQSQVMKAEQDEEETPLEGNQEEDLDALREALRAERIILAALEMELENERSAAAIATSEAMAMISRLQEEKSAMQMEVVQLQRMSEEKADYDEQAMELLKEILLKREKEKHALEKEVELYRERLLAEKADMLKKTSAEKSNKDVLMPALTPVLLLRGSDEEQYSVSPEGKNDRLKALPSLEAFYDAGIASSPHITSMGQNRACREHFALSPQPVELKDTKVSRVDEVGTCFPEDKGDLTKPFIKGLNGLPDIHQEPRGTSRSIFSTNDEETQFILERLWVLEEELRELRGEDGLGVSLEAQHVDCSPVTRNNDHSRSDSCGVRCIEGEIGEHKEEDGAGLFLPIHDVYEVQSTPNHRGQGIQRSDPLEYSENMLKDFESFPREISQQYMAASRNSNRPQHISHTRTLFPSKETHCDSALALRQDYPCSDDSHKQYLKATQGRLVTTDVIQQLAVRLQVLEADRELLREILESFRHRNTELKLLQEIAQYLRELQMVGSGRALAGGVLQGPFLPTFGQSCGRALKKRRYCSGPGQTQTLLLQQKSI